MKNFVLLGLIGFLFTFALLNKEGPDLDSPDQIEMTTLQPVSTGEKGPNLELDNSPLSERSDDVYFGDEYSPSLHKSIQVRCKNPETLLRAGPVLLYRSLDTETVIEQLAIGTATANSDLLVPWTLSSDLDVDKDSYLMKLAHNIRALDRNIEGVNFKTLDLDSNSFGLKSLDLIIRKGYDLDSFKMVVSNPYRTKIFRYQKQPV